MLTGAQIILECLIEQGVDRVFGYPGGQVIPLYDALYEYRDRIKHILTAHEQGASHAADGYARSTGKVGVCIATSGPGATNLVTGLATAYMDSVPVVAITGNVPVNLLGKDSFQEVDITGVTLPITKHNFIVKDIEDLAFTIRYAFEIARSGRPGPVLIDIPKNIQTESIVFDNKEYVNLKFSNIRITKMMKGDNPNIYGIQIKQDYYSSNYGDTGYLFLLVDMKDYQKPIIHLRTWQPQPDENLGGDGIFGPGNI